MKVTRLVRLQLLPPSIVKNCLAWLMSSFLEKREREREKQKLYALVHLILIQYVHWPLPLGIPIITHASLLHIQPFNVMVAQPSWMISLSLPVILIYFLFQFFWSICTHLSLLRLLLKSPISYIFPYPQQHPHLQSFPLFIRKILEDLTPGHCPFQAVLTVAPG